MKYIDFLHTKSPENTYSFRNYVFSRLSSKFKSQMQAYRCGSFKNYEVDQTGVEPVSENEFPLLLLS